MNDRDPKRTEQAGHGFATRAIHAGQAPDPATGAIMTPIYATSTYVQTSPGVHKGYDYARTANPTRAALEACVADLEGGARGFAFASGLAGMATVLDALDTGAHIVASDDLYGGTYRLFENVRKRSAGLAASFIDMTDPESVRAAIRPQTRMLWVETPSNPLLKLDRSRGGRRNRARARSDHRRRQHLRQPLDPAAARAWFRHRRPFGDQVSQRSFRHGRWRRRHRRRASPPAARRAARLSAERGRRHQRPVRQLPRAARPEDTGAAHGAALQQRRGAGALAHRTTRGRNGVLPGTRERIRSTRWRGGRCARMAGW